jgi:hypothetical protein
MTEIELLKKIHQVNSIVTSISNLTVRDHHDEFAKKKELPKFFKVENQRK